MLRDNRYLRRPPPLGAQCLLTRDAATPVADGSRNWWYKVTGSGWLPQSDVEDVNQYDLLKLGFQALEEESGGDVMDSPYEGWVSRAFDAVSRSAEQGLIISTAGAAVLSRTDGRDGEQP